MYDDYLGKVSDMKVIVRIADTDTLYSEMEGFYKVIFESMLAGDNHH